jgi:hypothetical protein
MRQVNQQLQRALGDAVFRVIQQQAIQLQGKALEALRISLKQFAHLHETGGTLMLVESGPDRAVIDTGFAVVKHDVKWLAIKNGYSILH